MSKDHFISVTFLNNFTDNNQTGEARDKTIFCFSKESNRSYTKTSTLGSIAYQQDLDGNGDFKDFLDVYEPKWSHLYTQITQSKYSEQDYEETLTYLLLLKLNNLKQQKERLDILLNQASQTEVSHLDSLKFKDKHKQIRDISIDLKYLEILKNIYLTLPYRIVKNDSLLPFVTSDNPWMLLPNSQFIPISKEYGLQICTELSAEYDARNQGLHTLSQDCDIKEINCCMINNAERFVYTSTKDVFKSKFNNVH